MPEDTKLVAASLEDPEAYAAVIDRYSAPLLRYICRLGRFSAPEAEDILQNVFLKAYQNLHSFDQSLKFSSWIYRIAHNETISAWRRSSARPDEVGMEMDDLAQLFRSSLDLESDFDDEVLSGKIREILQSLPVKYREVLVLRFLEDQSYEEIGDILRKPAGTIATLLNRAKKAFRQAAEEQNLAEFISVS